MATTYDSKIHISFSVIDIDALESVEDALQAYCDNRDDGSYFTYTSNRQPDESILVDLNLYVMVTGKADVNTVFNQADSFVTANIPDAIYRKEYGESVVPDEEE